MKSIVEELEYLTSIPALSGLEDKMISEMVDRLKPFADSVDVDRLGNVTAVFKGRQENESSMLVFAHLDELGLMISKVQPDGFLRFDRVGGMPEKTLLGTFVDVHSLDSKNYFTGVIGTYAHHLTPPEAKFNVPTIDKMYIDLGLESFEEVLERGINTGSAVTYHHIFKQISENRITSKTLDNRIGVLLLIALGEHLHDHKPAGDVYLVASVQEEFNVRGVLPVFARLEPNAAICLDITPACDTPDLNNIYNMFLGKGPAVMQMNFHGRGTLGGLIPNPMLRNFLEETLIDLKIPFQREIITGEITDDAFATMNGTNGCAMAHFSIPVRYSHSSIETSDLRDISDGIKGLKAFIDRFNHSLDLRRGV